MPFTVDDYTHIFTINFFIHRVPTTPTLQLPQVRSGSSLPSVTREKLDDGVFLCTPALPRYSSEGYLEETVRGRELFAEGHDKPLMLLFEFFLAKPRYIDKYIDIYHIMGFDVLTVQVGAQASLITKKTVFSMQSKVDKCDLLAGL